MIMEHVQGFKVRVRQGTSRDSNSTHVSIPPESTVKTALTCEFFSKICIPVIREGTGRLSDLIEALKLRGLK